MDRKHNDSKFKRKQSEDLDKRRINISPKNINNTEFMISPELLSSKNKKDPKSEEPFWKKELKTPYKPSIEK